MADRAFYLGRVLDPKSGTLSTQSVQYDPADLTTHAVVTGMTGSGKTGLCVTLLEEAALQGIPALIVDPKGDLTNLLLHFPDLLPADFKPWIDPDVARRAGKTLEQAASEAASAWREGLQQWGIPQERLLALRNSAQFAVYTPGSDAGIPVSVLSSLAAPPIAWSGNEEILREKISSTVTALLGLVGFENIEPLKSREHILLSNLFERAWSRSQDVELTELILQTQTPPFDKLGALSVESFFPAGERMDLAMRLNNILAAPSFEAWRSGQPLDVQALLFTSEGRPRHSVFYLAHLSDAERMFFVTLLFAAVETWMRAQIGTSTLRALLYMDEIFGYLPPSANPPSKPPLLRMLKQARAFGLGLLLATQNPVDVDYKGLSNAGTWFIGKLQTDQDKQRLLDGLESAAGGVSRAALDKQISALGKRAFILQNVHSKKPLVFQTRWAMNFLTGPLTRTHIPELNRLAQADIGAAVVAGARAPRSAPAATVPPVQAQTGEASATRPPVPAGFAEYFLPQNLSLPEAFEAAARSMPADAAVENVVYRPGLLAGAQVRFLDRKHGVDTQLTRAALVAAPEPRGAVRWEDCLLDGPALDTIDTVPSPGGRFAALRPPLDNARALAALKKDFADWIYRSTSIKARANQALKVFAGPDVTQGEFMQACADTARAARDAELAKKTAQIDRRIKSMQDKLTREERELRQDETEYNQRKVEEMGTHAENIVGFVTGRSGSRRVSTSLTKRRLTEQAKADVDESYDSIELYRKELEALRQEREQLEEQVNAAWGDVVNQITELTITPKKTDIYIELFGVAWLPFYLVRGGEGALELPAFGAQP